MWRCAQEEVASTSCHKKRCRGALASSPQHENRIRTSQMSPGKIMTLARDPKQSLNGILSVKKLCSLARGIVALASGLRINVSGVLAVKSEL